MNVSAADFDWLFPEKYSLKIGVLLKYFAFIITQKVNNDLKNFLGPPTGLINSESGQDQLSSVSTRGHFFSRKKGIEEAIEKLNKIGTGFYINKSYFLHDRSGFVKQTFITALHKTIFIYGSISYFNKKNKRHH